MLLRLICGSALPPSILCVGAGASLWWSVKRTLTEARERKKLSSATQARIYLSRRIALHHSRPLRAAQLCAGILYAAVVSYLHLIINPGSLTSAHVFGLLLTYLNVAATCWCLTIGLVPHLEKVLLDFSPVVSVASVASLALSTHFSGATGLAVHSSFLGNVLAYTVLWLLEDCPLHAYFPLHLTIVAVHGLAHTCSGAPVKLASMLLGYLGLGVILPVVVSGLLLPSTSQAKVPGMLHTFLSLLLVGYLLLEQLLREPLLVEPLQDAASSSMLARSLASVLAEPLPGRQYAYGLGESTGLSVMWSALVLLLVSALVSVLNEEDAGAPQGTASRSLLESLNKNTAAFAVLGALRGLPTPKKYAVVLMLVISLLQGVGILAIILGLLTEGSDSFVRTAPTVLLCVMLGVVVQVLGVVYVLVPMGADGADTAGGAAGGSPQGAGGAAAGGVAVGGGGSMNTTNAPTMAASEMETASVSTSMGGRTPQSMSKSLLTQANLAAQETMLARGTGSGLGLCNTETYSMLSGLSRGPSERLSMVGSEEPSADLRTRIEALANFKTFMQGLDQQPGVYSLDEFIRGAAAAMKGIFPGVAHASFCLLNSTRNCVNMYTFLGDGSRKPPRINVAVAPGTLIYHVLHNCQPVFISNVASFPGPYADVQFMRFVLSLRSVACLPLVVAGSRVLGVLRLGFEEQWNWTEQEKSIAKQLALVLSSTSNGMGVSSAAAGGGGAAAAAGAPGGAADPAALSPTAPMGQLLDAGSSVPLGMVDDTPAGYAAAAAGFTSSRRASLVMPPMMQAPHPYAGDPGGMPVGGMGLARSTSHNQGMVPSSLQYVLSPHFGMGGAMPVGSEPGAHGHGVGYDSDASGSAVAAAAAAMQSGVVQGGMDERYSLEMQIYQAAAAAAAAAVNAGHGLQSMSDIMQSMQSMQSMGMGMPPGGMGMMHAGMQPGGFGMGSYDQMGTAFSGMTRQASGAGPEGRVSSSGDSSRQLATGELDETWLLQRPASSQVRKALASNAAAQAANAHALGADLKMLEVIGRGGFGSVYKGFWRGMVVAVKVLEHEDEIVSAAGGSGGGGKLDTSSRRAALLEGAMTSTISHSHVVQTYDYRVVHLDPKSSMNGITRSRVLHETHIIMEFCDRGSLQDAIEQGVFVVDGPRGARGGSTEPEVDMALIIMTLAEVSCAMEYLHKHRITHRDLKPKNILLRSSSKDRRGYVAKVSDFGLSQVLPDTNKTQVSTKYSGTVTHMAPELIEDGKVYHQGDVFAFGIIMWEVFTSSTPYASMAHPQIMVGVVTHNLRPKFPDTCPEWYKNLAYRCWRKDPKARPPFTEVTKTLLAQLPDKEWKPLD